MTTGWMMRAVLALALLPCAAPPARAQDSAQAPRCVAAAGAADAVLVRYDCAGTGQWARVRFSVSLPAGWDVREMEERNVTLVARRGAAGMYVQGSDQLFAPRTARDSADFWVLAGDLLLDRVPTESEVQALIRDAGDEDGVRARVTRAQGTDSALAALASMLGSHHEQIQVVRQEREPGELGGQRAGAVREMQRVNGVVVELDGRVTVHNAVLYGVAFSATEEEFRAHRALWDAVWASFVIHPPAP